MNMSYYVNGARLTMMDTIIFERQRTARVAARMAVYTETIIQP
jgi:hypothetical protein